MISGNDRSIGRSTIDGHLQRKKIERKSKTEAVDKAKADSIAKVRKDALQPYAKVITGKVQNNGRLFKVHYVDGKYFFEIADSLFGRDILIEQSCEAPR